ncbi:glycine zipper 2TM domain-containing protein [Amaricoccus sp.]|uniref:glycine zipper 2TM domain-containing protein n=1 Tax=Amaricoccus sp. TaxID=1872485 RepID=UPI002611961D|nr:glycine zipper 2TM domain-containing protein [Amaricoccus sp.]HRO13345.1 glycine zipper 2TM domain-containing protein [Amaricoccus sp.]
MHQIGLVAVALGLAACATTPSYYGGVSAQNVNCGTGVLGGALLGGLAGNQVGKGQGQDLATIAGATVGGLFAATRPECQPQAYGRPYGQPVAYGGHPPQATLVGYDRYGRPIYR